MILSKKEITDSFNSGMKIFHESKPIFNLYKSLHGLTNGNSVVSYMSMNIILDNLSSSMDTSKLQHLHSEEIVAHFRVSKDRLIAIEINSRQIIYIDNDDTLKFRYFVPGGYVVLCEKGSIQIKIRDLSPNINATRKHFNSYTELDLEGFPPSFWDWEDEHFVMLRLMT